MKRKAYRLIVTAHPDDETLFFGGLILTKRDLPWKVICVTDGNADKRGKERKREFQKACKSLGVNEEIWLGLPDIYEKRLELNQLEELVSNFETPHEVYTHGPLGEYGHPHHMQVSKWAHAYFEKLCPIWHPATNCLPKQKIELSRKHFAKKLEILASTYSKEMRRFQHILPTLSTESYTKSSAKEVGQIVDYLQKDRKKIPTNLITYDFFKANLRLFRQSLSGRLF